MSIRNYLGKSNSVILGIVTGYLLFSCQSSNEPTHSDQYPYELTQIFRQHGGIHTWNSMSTLQFSIPRDNGDETITTDLKNRYSLINRPLHQLGFDGKNIWTFQKDTAAFKGNAIFSYNLMFYFFSMPFVLGDNGIMYDSADTLYYNNYKFPGIRISFGSDIGSSPKDEYILYYNEKNYQMEWLAYTATFFSGEKSNNFNIIKYEEWQIANDLLLPKTIQWHEYHEGKVGAPKNLVTFEKVNLSEKSKPIEFFKAPKEATLVQ